MPVKVPVQDLAICFLQECRRVIDNTAYDLVDYTFRLTHGNVSRDIAVGIEGDWQGRLTPVELRTLAESWLRHRLEHGYDAFAMQKSHRQLLQIPFGVADYWVGHRAFPH